MKTFKALVEELEPVQRGGPGTYHIHDKEGKYVGWQRHYKDAKFHASQIGGKAVKVPKKSSESNQTKHVIKMPDGTFAPMTKANIKTATQR